MREREAKYKDLSASYASDVADMLPGHGQAGPVSSLRGRFRHRWCLAVQARWQSWFVIST